MYKDKLLTAFKKVKRLLIISPKITSTVFLIIIFSVVSVFAQDNNLEQRSTTVEPKILPSPTFIPIPTPTPTPTIIIATPTPTKVVEKKEEVSQSITSNSNNTISLPTPSLAQTTVVNTSQGDAGLLTAVNGFRNSNGVSLLSSSNSLCLIAEKRLSELIAQGSLDNHAGFNKFFSSQTEFNAMGEIIFQSSSKQTAEYAVNEGWAKSTAGHRENMLDPKWNYGCGATNGFFSVFNFGKK